VTTSRTALRSAGAALGALALLVVLAGPALGHAELDTADPADKAVLETPPTTITMTFTEDLDPAKSSFKLLAPDGSTVASGGATAIRTMSVDGLELAPGAYQVKWTSASADDGDIERGELTFTVSQPSSASVSPTQNAAGSASPVASTPATPAASDAPVSTPAPSAAPAAPASSTGDVLLPIIIGLLLVGGVGAFVLRRSRGA
jgi:hypothetical protein